MIIDCHVHIGRNEHINASVDQLLKSMDQAHIDKSLVFAGKLNDIDNDYMLVQINQHKDRLVGVAASHLNDDAFDRMKLKHIIENREVAAVKFYLGYDHWYPSDVRLHEVLELLDGTGIAAIFHCGDCLNTVKKAKLKYAHPLGIDDVAVDFPNQKIVIAHIGYPWHRDAAEVCYKNKNVYTDISGFVYGKFSFDEAKKFQKVLQEFTDICPADKLLFGTDWPISDQQSYIQDIHSKFVSPRIMSETAKKVFNL